MSHGYCETPAALRHPGRATSRAELLRTPTATASRRTTPAAFRQHGRTVSRAALHSTPAVTA